MKPQNFVFTFHCTLYLKSGKFALSLGFVKFSRTQKFENPTDRDFWSKMTLAREGTVRAQCQLGLSRSTVPYPCKFHFAPVIAQELCFRRNEVNLAELMRLIYTVLETRERIFSFFFFFSASVLPSFSSARFSIVHA